MARQRGSMASTACCLHYILLCGTQSTGVEEDFIFASVDNTEVSTTFVQLEAYNQPYLYIVRDVRQHAVEDLCVLFTLLSGGRCEVSRLAPAGIICINHWTHG